MKGSTFAREGAPAVVDMKARQTARLDSDVQPAIVLPLTRTSLRADVPSPAPESPVVGLERLLRMALDRGGSTLYLVSGSSPAMRVDGEIRPLDGAPTLTPQQVDAYLRVVLPERAIDGLRGTLASEWTTEFAGPRTCALRQLPGSAWTWRCVPHSSAARGDGRSSRSCTGHSGVGR